MALFPSTSIPSAAAGGYDIDNSCRFNVNDSAKLTRTPSSAGNQKTWTISFWMKKTSINSSSMFVFSANNTTEINWASGNKEFGTQYNGGWFSTGYLQRDFSAWYHIVWIMDTTQATSTDRMKFYINGNQITSFAGGGTYPAQNSDQHVNNTVVHSIGSRNSGDYFDGYISEFHLVDGTALPVETFGEVDSDYGHWKAKEVEGLTYGTNGFYLDFKDSSNLGNDAAGSNNFTVSNLATHDKMTDSPTNNWCTLTPLQKDAGNSSHTYSEGNLKVVEAGGGGYWRESFGTFEVPKTDKWYMEFYHVTGYAHIGLMSGSDAVSTSDAIQTGHVWYDYDTQQGGSLNYNNSTQTTGGTGANLVYAISVDAGVVKMYKSNVLQHTFSQNLSNAGSNAVMPIAQMYGGATWVVNFGQDHTFAGNKSGGASAQDSEGVGSFYYSPPAGHKALCSKNLPDPAIKKPKEYFNTVLYGGTGSTRDVTGFGFNPDFGWIKDRTSTGAHALFDSVRGGDGSYLYVIRSNATTVQAAETDQLKEFVTDGFKVITSAMVNNASRNYVSWGWKAGGTPTADNSAGAGATPTAGSVKINGSNLGSALAGTMPAFRLSANTTAGFSIVKYQATGSNGTVGHGLSQAPNLIICRAINATEQWRAGSIQLQASMDFTDRLRLNDVSALVDDHTCWNDTAPTSTVFSVGTDGSTNHPSTSTYHIAYCWHSVEGYSKVGSYKGNGNTDGAFIYTGFRPAYVLTKRLNSTSDWRAWDTVRNIYNISMAHTKLNDTASENTSIGMDILSNGFKIRSADSEFNASGSFYLYLVFADESFKYTTAK